ncbi:MAG TPA: FAD-dependent oxidoreductase, partial [Thermoanaerobaculia bacterium]
MSFPAKPPTPDGRRSQLLKLLSVEGHPQVFVLGSQARYVTIYAQQVRALNLVSALAKSGYFSRSTRLAVVGGGIAGLTAAAAAARAGVGRVSVFEREPTVMRLQRNSEKRYVHPHIYDWPFEKEPHTEADLPVLGWSAGIAAAV